MKLSELIQYAEDELSINWDAEIICYLSMQEKREWPEWRYNIEEWVIDHIAFHDWKYILECSEECDE
jgi:hypothetical protein